MSIKLAVFDLAGTTVKDRDDVPRILRETLEENGVEITLEAAREVMGIPKPVAIRQLLRRFYSGPREQTPSWISAIHAQFIESMTEFYRISPFVEEVEGVSELFRRLKERQMTVIVDTGFDRVTTDAVLDRMQWLRRGLIDGSVSSDEVENGRPFPDMIHRAMEIAGVVEPIEVAKIGDTAADLMEGMNAGCGLVIGVTSGAQSADILIMHPHTHLVNNIEQVAHILTRDQLIDR